MSNTSKKVKVTLYEPEVRVAAWTDIVSGAVVEKGVTLSWDLPKDIDGMHVEVDGQDWGIYTGDPQSLNIEYPGVVNTLSGIPVQVKLRYVKMGPETGIQVLEIGDDINLVLSDLIILRDAGPSKSTICPLNQYSNDSLNATYKSTSDGDCWEVQYSDKTGGGAYKTCRVKITAPSAGSPTASLVITPGSGQTPVESMYVKEACDGELTGDFTAVQSGGADAAQVTLGGQNMIVRAGRDAQSDKMGIQIFSPQTYAVEVRLHN